MTTIFIGNNPGQKCATAKKWVFRQDGGGNLQVIETLTLREGIVCFIVVPFSQQKRSQNPIHWNSKIWNYSGLSGGGGRNYPFPQKDLDLL